MWYFTFLQDFRVAFLFPPATPAQAHAAEALFELYEVLQTPHGSIENEADANGCMSYVTNGMQMATYSRICISCRDSFFERYGACPVCNYIATLR